MKYYSFKSCSGVRRLLGVFIALIACINLNAQKVSDAVTDVKDGLGLPGVGVLAPSATAHRLTVYMSPSEAGSVAIEGVGGGSPAIVTFLEEGQRAIITASVTRPGYSPGYFMDEKGVALGGTNVLYYNMPDKDVNITYVAIYR